MASTFVSASQARPIAMDSGQADGKGTGRARNGILSRLEPEDYDRFSQGLVPVELTSGQRLGEPGRPVEFVYFPVSGLIAIDALAEAGVSVQVGMVGREGMVGLCGIFNHPQMPNTVTVQSSGAALRVRSAAVREEFERGGALPRLVNAFFYRYLVEVSQSVLCNRLHSINLRLARWLLSSADRLGEERIQMTQEQMAQALGARRSTVTVAAGELQAAGLIDYRRGRIRIVNWEGLETAACECYAVVRRARLLLESPAT